MLCSLMKLLRSNVRFASGSALLPPRTTAAALPAHGRCLHNPLLHRSTGVSAWRTATRCQASMTAAPAELELPAELKKIVTMFKAVPDPKLKYQQLLAYAKKLPPLPAEEHTEDNKVRGCVSQVWVVPEVREDKVYWRADSDSALTKGLAALLVQGLSGCAAEQIARLSPEWITAMGLSQSLTPSRNNGFLNMFLLMQKKALGLLMDAGPPAAPAAPAASGSYVHAAAENGAAALPQASSSGAASAASGGGGPSRTPVRDSMLRKLAERLRLEMLEVVDESAQHAGHAGARETDSPSGETHFRVALVSPEFEGLPTIKRHRLVYQALAEELAGPVHALSLDTKAPSDLAKG